jgi:hypothetical protein
MPPLVRLAAAVAALAMGSVALASTANDICAAGADPCVLSVKKTVTDGSVLDFGSRTLDIQSGAQISVADGGGFSILAGALRIRPAGALKAVGGTIDVTTGPNGNMLIELSGTSRGKIDVSGPNGGTITLCTPACETATGGGTVTVNGDLLANATVPGSNGLGGGGSVSVTAQALTVGLNGSIGAVGGGLSSGGSIDIFTAGNITLNGPISVAGGTGDGGDITLDAGADVVGTALINLNGRVGNYGSGGIGLDVFAVGSISLAGDIDGRGAGTTTAGGGDGAEVFLLASNGDVTLNGKILADGAPPDGFGGGIEIDADNGSVFLNNLVSARGLGTLYSIGGDVSFSAGGSALGITNVDVSGGAAGGTVDAGAISGTLGVSGTINANGTATGAGGGAIGLQACDVSVQPGAVVTSLGVQGETDVNGSNDVTLKGTWTSAANRIFYRDPAKPPVTAGSTFMPAADVVLDAGLPPCGGFPPTTTTTTLFPPTTTTTLFPPPTTTTTAPPVTTTTTSSTTTTTTSSTTTTTTSSTTTTTTTTSTTSTTVTTTTVTTSSSTTTTPTTSTSSSTTVSSTSTTASTAPVTTSTAPLPACDAAAPEACDDGDPCTVDSCDPVAGCQHDPLTDIAAVGCRLDALAATIASEPPDAFGGARIQRQLGAKVRSAQAKVAAAAAATRPTGKLRRASRKLRAFMKTVRRGVASGRIRAVVGTQLLTLASGAAANIQPLL